MTDRSHLLGVAALCVAGLMFGVTFVVVQDAIDSAEVSSFLGVRFLIGAAVLAPLAFRRPATPHEVRHGFIAGLCLLGGFLFQTVGLYDTTPAASAFLTYLLVVIVPIVVAIRTRKPPSRQVVIGVLLAVAGLYALSGATGSFGRGEALTLGCAVMFAFHIIVLSEVSERHDTFRLTFWQVLTVGVVCIVPGAFAGSGPNAGLGFPASVWVAAVFCGVGATATAFWCQSWAQKHVSGSQAAIILLLEPVSAGILGELMGDNLGWKGALGAVLILAAVIVTEVLGRAEPVAVGAELAVIVDDGPEP